MVKHNQRARPAAFWSDDVIIRFDGIGVKLDQSAIARIEQGDRFVLDLEAIAIAKVFKVPVERLFVRKAL
jgi:hypothetical protein